MLSDSSASTATSDSVADNTVTTAINSVITRPPVVVTATTVVSGTVVVQTYTSTPAPITTSSPSLNSSGGDSASPGLSTSARNTIIGVVVGVGGTILLLGIAAVIWRVWDRKKDARDNDEDDLMSAGTAVGTANREKVPITGSGTPFQSTLDQYHKPVNAASNF